MHSDEGDHGLFNDNDEKEAKRMMKEMGLDEHDLEDLKEIRTLEKIASIKESQGIKNKNEHS